jgi:protein fuzzy
VISRNLQPNPAKRTLSGSGGGTHRLDILRSFFHQSIDIIDEYIQPKAVLSKQETSKSRLAESEVQNLEQYFCSDYHKCHVLIEGPNIMCVLYVAAIPTHTMRLVLWNFYAFKCENNIIQF